MTGPVIRSARESDAAGVLAIYGPVVRETAISFEVTAPGEDDIRQRLSSTLKTWPWLVACEGHEVVGYAYGGRFRAREAYRWSVEVSAYVAAEFRGRGVASGLYRTLLALLRAQGFAEVQAGITLPNEASVRLHESMGFTPVGVYRRVGFKHGAWHDVGWWQRSLGVGGEHPSRPAADPREPVPFEVFRESAECATILDGSGS